MWYELKREFRYRRRHLEVPPAASYGPAQDSRRAETGRDTLMATGNREPNGEIALRVTIDEAKLITQSLDATAKTCSLLIAAGPHGEHVPGSMLHQLPGSVIRALREAVKAHLDLMYEIHDATQRSGGGK